MAREIVAWCDAHIAQDPPVYEKGSEVVVQIDRAKPLRLDLCEPCRKELVGPLEGFLAEMGVTVDAPARRGGVPGNRGGAMKAPTNANGPLCPVKPCKSGNRPFKGNGALQSHLRAQHGLTSKDMRRDYPAVMADMNHRAAAVPEQRRPESMTELSVEDYTCGIDGCEKAYPPWEYTRSAQAIGIHRKKHHGVDGPHSPKD